MNSYFTAFLAVGLLLWCLAAQAGAQGSLGELRANVRQSRPSKEVQGSYSTFDDDDAFDDDDGGGFLSAILSGMVSAAFSSTADSHESHTATRRTESVAWPEGYFPSYPYQGQNEGFMVMDRWSDQPLKLWSLQTRVEYADNFGDQSRIGGNFLFETTSRFGLDTDVNYRRESLPGGLNDSLWTGDSNLLFRFWQSPRLQQRVGVGVNWLSDNIGQDYGWNLTYSSDWRLHRPWVISSEIDYGGLGGASLFHGRLTTGLQWNRVEIYIGYDYYEVGSVQLDGMVSGLRFFF